MESLARDYHATMVHILPLFTTECCDKQDMCMTLIEVFFMVAVHKEARLWGANAEKGC